MVIWETNYQKSLSVGDSYISQLKLEKSEVFILKHHLPIVPSMGIFIDTLLKHIFKNFHSYIMHFAVFILFQTIFYAGRIPNLLCCLECMHFYFYNAVVTVSLVTMNYKLCSNLNFCFYVYKIA